MKKLGKLSLGEIKQSMPIIDQNEQENLMAGSGNPYSLAYYYYSIGTAEVVGSESNPDILDFFTATSYVPTDDSKDGWCSAFANYCVYNSGGSGTNSALASSWLTWGSSTNSPQVGDIAVANDGSHVGIVQGVNADGTVTVIDGNYSNKVSRHDVSSSSYSFRTAN